MLIKFSIAKKKLMLSTVVYGLTCLSLANAEIQSETAFTPEILFQNAIKAGEIADLKALIQEKNMDVNQAFSDGASPLHVAVAHNQETSVKELLDQKAKVDATDPTTGATPLHLAALYGRENIARLLIERGANVNATMKFNLSPLLVAAEFKHANIIELLVSKKANINFTDQEGFSALHFAAKNGDEAVAKILLDHGANVNLQDKNNRSTPLKIASDNNQMPVANLLRAKGAK
jgi:ankyrin repeat protein